jgi:hypothetical protein
VEIILTLRRDFPAVKIVAISGGGRINSVDYLTSARKFGIRWTLAKPFTGDELKVVHDAALGVEGTAPPTAT